MTVRKPRYSREEHARRGTTSYEEQVRPLVEAGDLGKIVAIDVDGGAYELAEDTLARISHDPTIITRRVSEDRASLPSRAAGRHVRSSLTRRVAMKHTVADPPSLVRNADLRQRSGSFMLRQFSVV